eukprot:512137_1
MTDATNRIINHIFTKDLFLLQPPNAKSWSEFDKAIFNYVYDEIAARNCFMPHLANAKSIQAIIDVIRGFFFNIMSKVATQHRYEGRYNNAYDVWMHMFDYMNKINFNKHDFPLHFGEKYVTICVMYMNWPGMSEKIQADMTLIYCKKALECVKIAKQMRTYNPIKYKYETLFREVQFDEFVVEAQVYHHMGNAYSRLYNEKLEKLYYTKTFEIYSNINSADFTGDCVRSQIHYFMVDYTHNLMIWDPLKKSKLIKKLSKLNVNEAKKQFGEISLEVVQTVTVKGDYHWYLLSEHKQSIKQYEYALKIALKVLTKFKESGQGFFCCKVLNIIIKLFESMGNILERFGDFCGAAVNYAAAMEFLQIIVVEYDKKNNNEFIEKEKSLEDAFVRLERYDPSKELHRNCKVCYKHDKKMRKKFIKNGVKRYLHRIGKINDDLNEYKEDEMLQNMGRYRRCKYCNKANVKLLVCKGCKSVFYCNHRHQKLHWKQHRNECKEIKCCKRPESFVELLGKIN